MTQLFNSLLLSTHNDYLGADQKSGYSLMIPFEVLDASAIIDIKFSIKDYTTVLWSVLDSEMQLVSSREQELNYGKHHCTLQTNAANGNRYFLKIQSTKKFPVHQIAIG
jgi:hypothetical protein